MDATASVDNPDGRGRNVELEPARTEPMSACR